MLRIVYLLLLSPLLLFSEQQGKSILLVCSYHNGMIGTDLMVESVQKNLKGQVKNIYIEYLDGKRFDQIQVLKNFSLIKEKYNNKDLDLIMAFDDLALELFLKERTGKLYDLPIVFAGINHLEGQDLSKKSDITGVTEEFDLKGNVELIHLLHPNKKTIHAIIDQSITGNREKHRLQNWINSNSQYDIQFLDDWTYDELAEKLSKLPKEDVLLSLTLFVDRDGNSKNMGDISRYIRTHAKNPIYGGHDVKVGKEILGGKVVSLVKQGEIAGSLALEVLSGVPASRIPINRESTHKLLFDYHYLNRFNVDASNLPREAVVINQPTNLIIDNLGVFIGLLTFILTLIIFTFILLFINRKLKLKEKVLLELKKQAEEASRAKSDFLSLVSHELKSPLNPILGMCQLLEQRDEIANVPEAKHDLNVISRSALRLLNLVNDILDFIQLDRKEVVPNTTKFNLSQTLEPTFDAYHLKAENKHLKFDVKGLQDIDLIINSDAKLLIRMIEGLLSNAIKFTREGEVSIVFEKTNDLSKPTIKICVSDTGIGMDQATFENAMLPFSQNDSSTTRVHEGTGLGLSICKNICALLGGDMKLGFHQELGTTLIIFLPISHTP